jgi:hypothetical protein
MEPLQGKHWPDFFDANGNGYKAVRPENRNANKKMEAQIYKVNKDFSVTPWLCYESVELFNFPQANDIFSNHSKNYVDKQGNFLFLSNYRNGPIIYKVDKNGVKTGIAGNSFHGNEIKDGKGSQAWLGRNTKFVSQTKDGKIFLIDYADGNSDEYTLLDFPNQELPNQHAILRVLTPDGEIKTVKDKNGNCFFFKPNHKIISISENGYWYYANGGIINRFLPGLVINNEEHIAGINPELNDPYKERKMIKLGEAKSAILFGSEPICAIPSGEVYAFNSYWNRVFLVKNNMVTEFCGNSDLSTLRISLRANASQKEGNAKTAEIGNMKKLIYQEGNLYSLHYDGNNFIIMKIDIKGITSFVK